jgi:TetR/AcrR family transcriptional regulator, transcriptional repressor for nem operon
LGLSACFRFDVSRKMPGRLIAATNEMSHAGLIVPLLELRRLVISAFMAKSNVREKLIEAGLDNLHRRGFNGCGVQQITETAGVPKGSFYNHFESKEALGAAVLDHYWRERAGSTLRILAELDVRPIERLRRYFAAMAAKMERRGYVGGCLIGNLGAELSDQSELARDGLNVIFARWTEAIESCIRDGQRRHEIRPDFDAPVLASFLINAWEGAILRAKVAKNGAPLDEFSEVVFRKLLLPPSTP